MYSPVKPCVKIEFTGDDFEPMDVTQDISNWKELEVSQERDDLSGVITEILLPINVTGDSKEFLQGRFDSYGLYAAVTVNIYRRADFSNDYTLVKSMPLDFSTYKEYDDRIEIEGVNASLSEIIKSCGRNKYDIPVSEIQNDVKWYYERIANWLNKGIYMLPVDTDQSIEAKNNQMQFTISLSSATLLPGLGDDFKGQSLYGGVWESGNYFYKADGPRTIQFTAQFSIDVTSSLILGVNPHGEGWVTLYKIPNGNTSNPLIISSQPLTYLESPSILEAKYTADVNMNQQITLGQGDELRMTINFRYDVDRIETNVRSCDTFSVSFTATAGPLSIPVVTPTVLLQKFLDLMSENPGQFTGVINWETEDHGYLICPAEVLKDYPNPTLHGSPNDFIEWMNVLGYEYDIDNNTITFRKRYNYYNPQISAMVLEEGEVADLIKQASTDYAYTNVRVGYDKEDYDNINGDAEVFGAFEYTTGLKSKDGNQLDLISPYRADSIGIELACQQRGDDDDTDKTDNDIFVIAVNPELSGNGFTTYLGNSILSNGLELFNYPLNPHELLLANSDVIGIVTDKCTFTGTDMNRTATVRMGSIDLYGDESIKGGIFDPIEYNFACGSWQELPDSASRDGLIRFWWKDKYLRGYIKNIQKNYGAETDMSYTLFARIRTEITYELQVTGVPFRVPAEGGTYTVSAKLIKREDGFVVSTETVVPTLSPENSWITVDGLSITVASRGTEAGNLRFGTVRASYNVEGYGDVETFVPVLQSENVASLSSISIYGTASEGSVDQIPAYGGTITWDILGNYTYSSSATMEQNIDDPESGVWIVEGGVEGVSQDKNVTTWAPNTGAARTATIGCMYEGKFGSADTTQLEGAVVYNYTPYIKIRVNNLNSYPVQIIDQIKLSTETILNEEYANIGDVYTNPNLNVTGGQEIDSDPIETSFNIYENQDFSGFRLSVSCDNIPNIVQIQPILHLVYSTGGFPGNYKSINGTYIDVTSDSFSDIQEYAITQDDLDAVKSGQYGLVYELEIVNWAMLKQM